MTENHQNGGSNLEELIRLAQGKVTASERKAIENRIAVDSELKGLYEVIRLLVKTSDQLMSADVSSVARLLGVQVFRDFRKRKSAPSLKKAIKLFDSANMPLPEGVRPAAVDTRRLKYRFPEGVLELALYPISLESFEIVGMISEYHSSSPFRVSVQSVRRVEHYESDEVNLFRIPRISRGKHEIKVYSDDRLIGTATLEL